MWSEAGLKPESVYSLHVKQVSFASIIYKSHLHVKQVSLLYISLANALCYCINIMVCTQVCTCINRAKHMTKTSGILKQKYFTYKL